MSNSLSGPSIFDAIPGVSSTAVKVTFVWSVWKAFQTDQTKVTFTAVEDTPGIASKILGPLSELDMKVDVIVQNVGIEGKTDFTFTIATEEKSLLDEAINKIQKSINYREVIIDDEIAKVSIVGVGIRPNSNTYNRNFSNFIINYYLSIIYGFLNLVNCFIQ